MSNIDTETARIAAKNLTTLMDKYNLTTYGTAAGAEVEVHTINRILSMTTNISTRVAKKLSKFFGIGINHFFSLELPKLKKIEQVPTLKDFYEANTLNHKYFQDRSKENQVAHFLRTEFIHNKFLETGQRASAVTKYINQNYSKNFNKKTVAKELFRLYEAGDLLRDDPSGKGAVYYYRRAKKESE